MPLLKYIFSANKQRLCCEFCKRAQTNWNWERARKREMKCKRKCISNSSTYDTYIHTWDRYAHTPHRLTNCCSKQTPSHKLNVYDIVCFVHFSTLNFMSLAFNNSSRSSSRSSRRSNITSKEVSKDFFTPHFAAVLTISYWVGEKNDEWWWHWCNKEIWNAKMWMAYTWKMNEYYFLNWMPIFFNGIISLSWKEYALHEVPKVFYLFWRYTFCIEVWRITWKKNNTKFSYTKCFLN